MRMYRWMGSNCFTTKLTIMGLHFYDLLEWCRTFSGFQGSENSGMKGFKKTENI